MVLEENILVIATFVLAGAGAFSAFVGYIKETQAFDPKRFAQGVITGVLGGIGLVLLNATNIVQAIDPTQQWILIGSLALGIIGVDTLRTGFSGSIASRAEAETQPTQ